MASPEFGLDFVNDLVARCEAGLRLTERHGVDAGPFLAFSGPDGEPGGHGFLRLWAGEGLVDRMIHVRLAGDPADTQLFFLFGRADTTMPHFHGQVVQFGPDACIYNADLLPRLDPVDHPDYYKLVFGPITKAYWRATQKPEHACASAPANPAIAAYLSPWSIGAARPAQRAELELVGAQIHAYLDHWLALVTELDYPGGTAEELRERDRRHLAAFFDERLDPRAWKGVYRLVGEDQGREIRQILMNSISQE